MVLAGVACVAISTARPASGTAATGAGAVQRPRRLRARPRHSLRSPASPRQGSAPRRRRPSWRPRRRPASAPEYRRRACRSGLPASWRNPPVSASSLARGCPSFAPSICGMFCGSMAGAPSAGASPRALGRLERCLGRLEHCLRQLEQALGVALGVACDLGGLRRAGLRARRLQGRQRVRFGIWRIIRRDGDRQQTRLIGRSNGSLRSRHGLRGIADYGIEGGRLVRIGLGRAICCGGLIGVGLVGAALLVFLPLGPCAASAGLARVAVLGSFCAASASLASAWLSLSSALRPWRCRLVFLASSLPAARLGVDLHSSLSRRRLSARSVPRRRASGRDGRRCRCRVGRARRCRAIGKRGGAAAAPRCRRGCGGSGELGAGGTGVLDFGRDARHGKTSFENSDALRLQSPGQWPEIIYLNSIK